MLESAQAADAAKDEKKRDQKHQRPHRLIDVEEGYKLSNVERNYILENL